MLSAMNCHLISHLIVLLLSAYGERGTYSPVRENCIDVRNMLAGFVVVLWCAAESFGEDELGAGWGAVGHYGVDVSGVEAVYEGFGAVAHVGFDFWR